MAGTSPTELWQIGDWVADASDDSISRDGETIKLEPRTMRLLLRLAEAAGAVVSQDQLLNEVWAGVVVGPASVYQSVSQLRKLLRDTDSPPTYIATISRKGYRLLAPTRRLERRPPAHATPAPLPPPPSTSVVPTAPAPPAATEPPFQPLSPPKVRDRRRQRTIVGSGLGLVVVVLLALAWVPFKKYLARVPPTPSIVVLPFVDMSSDKSEQAFCDGLTEELSSWLAQLPSLRVVARTSAFSFKDKPTDVREIGRQLGTTYVLEGSLRRTGNYMRITVQLIDARNGYHQWAGSYDAPVADVIKVQEDIARSIATNLEIRLAKLTIEGFAARGSSSAEAYQLYLSARYHWRLLTRADNERAIGLYKQAIAADGNFAPAYIGLVYAYLNQQNFNDRAITDIAAEAQPLLAKVEKLQPNLVDLYVARGMLELRLLHEDAALRDLQHAVALNPNSRDAHAQLGLLHLFSGQPRAALQDYTNATVLDPLDPYLHAQRCLALQDLARLEEANSECETARAMAPTASWAYTASSWLADAQGRVDEALRWNAEALKRSPKDTDLIATRGKWQLIVGLPQQARETYKQAAQLLAGDAESIDDLSELAYLTALATGGITELKSQLATISLDAASTRTLLDLAQARLMAGDMRGARELVDRGLAQHDYDLRVTSNAAWEAREGFSYPLIAAYTYLHTDSPNAAAAQLQLVSALVNRLIAAGTQRRGIYEIKAKVAALQGDADQAMRMLERARALGWRNTWAAEHEPFLQPLWARNDFRGLTQQINADNASTRAKLPAPAVAAGP